jgi:hypothetical protein
MIVIARKPKRTRPKKPVPEIQRVIVGPAGNVPPNRGNSPPKIIKAYPPQRIEKLNAKVGIRAIMPDSIVTAEVAKTMQNGNSADLHLFRDFEQDGCDTASRTNNSRVPQWHTVPNAWVDMAARHERQN